MLEPGFERVHDRRAPCRLSGVHLRQLPVDEANLTQLAKPADDARQQRAAGDGRHQVLRVAPSQLLDDLESERLRSFRVVRAQVDVDEAPAIPVRHLRAEPIHIVVIAGDGENRRIEDRGPEQLAGFEVVRDEHAAVDAEPCGMGGDAVRQVAGRGAREHVESELDGARRRHRDDAVLVGERGMVDRVVLDVELVDAEPRGQAIAAHERREAGVEPRSRLAGNRQQLAIAPQIFRPARDLLARQRDRAVVVQRLQWTEAPIAHVGRLRRKEGLAQMTLESQECAHTASVSAMLESSRSEVRRTKSEVRSGKSEIGSKSDG